MPLAELAFVALGSNMGNRKAYLKAARRKLAGLPDTSLVAESGIEKTKPLGPIPQRKYLNVIDGIVANEKDAGGYDPYNARMVLAGIDPVAVDAVACRLMGYNFQVLRTIQNMTLETVYPVGDHDPSSVAVIVGSVMVRA